MSNSTNNDLNKKIKSIKRHGTLQMTAVTVAGSIIGSFCGYHGEMNARSLEMQMDLIKNNEIDKIKKDSSLSEEEKRAAMTKIAAECETKKYCEARRSKILGYSASAAVGVISGAVVHLINKETKREIGKAYGIAKSSDKKKGDSK